MAENMAVCTRDRGWDTGEETEVRKCRVGSCLHLKFWYFVHHRSFCHNFYLKKSVNILCILILKLLSTSLNFVPKAS